nr:zinc finger, CCHC-type [Tanacetum cinerariifolium]
MGDENHIRTLRDYSKPIHEGYMNTIELPVGNNVVPLRSDTIQLVQNGFSFHGLRLVNTITIHPKQQSDPLDDKSEENKEEEQERKSNPNTIAFNEEQRNTPQLEWKHITIVDNLGPNRDDEGIKWLDVEEPLDLVDISEESVYESLIKDMPKCSLNYDFRIEKGDPRNLKIPCMIGSMNYYIDFTILENIETNINVSLSRVIFGRPFIEIPCLAINRKHGLTTFIDETKEITFKTPYKDPERSELSSEGHDLLSSRVILSEDDYDIGYRKPSDLEDGFYRDTIKLGPEYLTGIDDEVEVAFRMIGIHDSIHLMKNLERSNLLPPIELNKLHVILINLKSGCDRGEQRNETLGRTHSRECFWPRRQPRPSSGLSAHMILFCQVMEWYPHLDNDIYDIVDQVIRLLALVQERKAHKDREIKKGRHSTSSSSVFHHGSSSHQFDDGKEIQEEGCAKVIGKGYQRSFYEEEEVNEDEVGRAQSSRVSVSLPEDPYETIRQAYLVGMDTESEPFKDPIETETPDSPHTVAPLTCHVRELKGSSTFDARSTSLDSTASLSPDHPLTHTTPVLVPSLRRTARMAVRVPLAMSPGLSTSIAEVAAMSDSMFCKRFRSFYDSSPSPTFPGRKRYKGTSELILDTDSEEDEEVEESSDSDSESEDAEDEGPTVGDEGPTAGDEGLVAENEGPGMGVGSPSLGGDEVVPGGKQRAALVMKTIVGEPLGLGYKAFRRQEIASRRVRSLVYLRGCITYIDVPAYPPPVPPVQTPPLPEWSSTSAAITKAATTKAEGFLAELGAQVEMQRGLIHNHTVRSGEISPTLFERYRFKSLEHEPERAAVTFRALWRPMLALEAWARRRVAARAEGDDRPRYYFGAGEGP